MAKVKARVKVQKKAIVGEVIQIKTLISHPMHSGRAVDADGRTIPRNIIKSFTAKFNGNTVFNVDLKPSVASNPFLVFPFKVTESGTFDFNWVEDGGKEYTASKNMKIA
jgi:sulfur-oxidizing protein SoxZ